MKGQAISCTLLALVTALPISAQRGVGGGRAGTTVGSSQSRRTIPDLNSGTNLFLSGKVVLEDGAELGEGAAIQTICRGQKHTETYSDSHGNFNFQFTSRLTANSGAGLGDSDTSMWS